jgi:pantetheine-phosphate adenylyltransferase
MKVCIGGTFNVLHKGHKMLLEKAFQIAGKKGIVYIGVSEDKLLDKKDHFVSYESRVNALIKYLKTDRSYNNFSIVSISDEYGLTIDEDYDAIIVSPETKTIAEVINNKRINIGKKPLKIVVVSFVLAEDNKPISSTRVLNKEIDENGKVLK